MDTALQQKLDALVQVVRQTADGPCAVALAGAHAKAMADAAAGLNAEYDEWKLVADRVIEDRGRVTVDRALLEQAGTLEINDCGRVTIEPDVSPELIREKLLKIEDCGTVICTAEQRAAVEQASKDVGRVLEPGQEKRGEEDEESPKPEEEVRKVNAATYVL